MPRLFERFHRIETAASRSNEGSGIGLALVQELVGLHGGTITAESTEGAGTTFTIRLPFGAAHLPAEANLARRPAPALVSAVADPFVQEALRWLPGDQPAEPTLSRGRGGRPRRAGTAGRDLAGRGAPARVLVADDNADMREYLARLLQRRLPGRPRSPTGRQALDAVRAQPFDLVISDVMMPRLDGLAWSRRCAPTRAPPRPAGAAAVGAGRAGGGHRGPAGRRGRLPGQAVLRRRTAGPGAGQRRTGPAAQPPRPLAHRADRFAAGGVLRLRRAGARHRDQRRVHRHPRVRRGRPAVRTAPTRGGPTRTPIRKPGARAARHSPS